MSDSPPLWSGKQLLPTSCLFWRLGLASNAQPTCPHSLQPPGPPTRPHACPQPTRPYPTHTPPAALQLLAGPSAAPHLRQRTAQHPSERRSCCEKRRCAQLGVRAAGRCSAWGGRGGGGAGNRRRHCCEKGVAPAVLCTPKTVRVLPPLFFCCAPPVWPCSSAACKGGVAYAC